MKRKRNNCREIIAYLLCGAATTVVNWVIYSVAVKLIGSATWSIAVSNLISWIAAVAFAFITNKVFVFQSRSWEPSILWPELWKFVSARIATGVIEIVLVPLLVGFGMDMMLFGIEGSAAKVIVSIIVVILNYVFSKLFIFNKEQKRLIREKPSE